MTNTFQMVGWEGPHISESVSEPTLLNANRDWINQRSRGELGNLLIKVDGILKERENGTPCKIHASLENLLIILQNSV